MKLLLLDGPNLNLLGSREPALYGRETLAEIEQAARREAEALGMTLSAMQSNHEGALIDALHDARGVYDGVILNAGGYSHTSVALRDAVAAVGLPCVEVHLTNIYSREDFRRTSLLSPVCAGCICGFGAQGYLLAVRALGSLLQTKENVL